MSSGLYNQPQVAGMDGASNAQSTITHSMDHGDNEKTHAHRLYFIKSPVVGEEHSPHGAIFQPNSDLEGLGYRDGKSHDCPEFEKHEEATHSELFYDLFFAANLTVFSEVHQVTNVLQLTSYIGFFCTLWFCWALVGLFDVRFVTDSIFERTARAVHLGVMVGFAVVAANFDPIEQSQESSRPCVSLILMVSRLMLAVQYSTIVWHVRRFGNSHKPLAFMVGLNLFTAMAYLGISFVIPDEHSHVYIAWYGIGAGELIISAVASLFWRVLSFEGTHLINRMSLLTLIIIGEGIIVICGNISRIVKNTDAWTSATIGNVTTAVAMFYIVWMVYLDWLRHLHLPQYRQLIWAVVHFPFHLSLTLFVEGSAELVIWYKVLEVFNWFNGYLLITIQNAEESTNITSNGLVEAINKTVEQIWERYPPQWQDTYDAVQIAFEELGNVTDAAMKSGLNETNPATEKLTEALQLLSRTISNSLLANFDIQGFTAAGENNFTGTERELEEMLFDQDWQQYDTVFCVAFICAGIVLLLLDILYLISRTKRLTPFNYFRTVLYALIAIGLCLVSLVDKDRTEAYKITPWALPIICLTYSAVLVINHLPRPPPLFFRRGGTASFSRRTVFTTDDERKRTDTESVPGSYARVQ